MIKFNLRGFIQLLHPKYYDLTSYELNFSLYSPL